METMVSRMNMAEASDGKLTAMEGSCNMPAHSPSPPTSTANMRRKDRPKRCSLRRTVGSAVTDTKIQLSTEGEPEHYNRLRY